MKLQFSTKSVLLATAFVGIALGGFGPLYRNVESLDSFNTVLGDLQWIGLTSVPIFVPIVFAAYAIGRRALTWQTVLAFAATELAAYLLIR